MNENLTDITYVSIYHNYIHTPVKMEASTIKKAIEKGNYISNACWYNALTEFYGDTIMSKKTRKQLTVEKIIEITGKTDFYESGLSINDMSKVFEEFKIPARIYNFCNRLIYKFTPPNQNWHIKPFYAMVKNNHVYVLNHDLKSIQQKQDNHRIPTVKASTDFYINDKEEATQYRMIENCDDILKLQDEKDIFIISRLNDLNKIFFDLMDSGYEPRIKFQAGIINQIKLKMNNITYTIKTQNLVKDSSDGCIAVSKENTYNNMNKAMFKFNKSLFNSVHKSFYNDIDIKIMNEARTIIPMGVFFDKKEKVNVKNLVEIDVSKAFTHAFLQINQIPVFNQFDMWKVLKESDDINKFHKLTLYYVKNNSSSHRILLNKKYCLLYGVFLQQIDLTNIDILYYKEPSQIHACNYKDLVGELWKNTISEDEAEDTKIKKLIANVNYGLLEKGGNTDVKSIPFKKLNEAMDYQAQYGGKLHKIEEETYEQIEEINDDDKWCVASRPCKGNREPFYILNIRDKAELKNGFRYIKELLLQHHNFKMYQDYNMLNSSAGSYCHYLKHKLDYPHDNCSQHEFMKANQKYRHVRLYSVKTDAFTIDKNDLEVAMQQIDFNNNIGGWRVSKNNDINLPSVSYEIVDNEFVEIQEQTSQEIKIEDEYDTDNIIKEIETSQQVMIRAVYAGSGKSYICQKMRDKGHTVLFVCPTNRLLQEFGGDAITINKFFGISFGNVVLEKFDCSGYDVIVFDEIYFSGLNVYWKIEIFVEDNKGKKIIIATGDTKQLKAVQELTNTKDYETYVDEIIDNIFEYNILLKECKRLNTQEDKDKLFNIKQDIFYE